MLELDTTELKKQKNRKEAEELRQMAITLIHMLDIDHTTGAEVFRYRKVLDDLMKKIEEKMRNNNRAYL